MQKQEMLVAQPRVQLAAAGTNYGRFAIEPLQPGHGSPLGNALRRVLFSSIPGAAVTRIKLGGVIHEFSTIPGVLEDGTQLVLNVKGIRLRSYSERAVTMQLVKRGPGPVFASDIAKNWNRDGMTTADAFAHYYAHFTRDQRLFEANIARLRTPVRVVWGERDIYIRPDMGKEFAEKAGLKFEVLRGIGHYPHLQDPQRTAEEVRASFR